MSAINTILAKGVLPDAVIRLGIRQRLAADLNKIVLPTAEAQRAALLRHVEDLRSSPVAIHTDEREPAATRFPPSSTNFALGPRLKISRCAWFDSPGIPWPKPKKPCCG